MRGGTKSPRFYLLQRLYGKRGIYKKKFPALRNTMREIIVSKLQTNYLCFFLANTSLAAAWAAAKRAIGTRKAEQET